MDATRTRPNTTPLRQERAKLAALLRAEGKTLEQIAVVLGISRSYASGLISDPDGKKDFLRKRGYAGSCADCGTPTSGSNGSGSAPRLCTECNHRHQAESRYWTRERIIEAIQHFAAEHGRPPLSTDWNHTGRGEGYPPISSVYRSSSGPNAPFATWADAIEAAGFPRPRIGEYERTPEIIAKQLATRGYPIWTWEKIVGAMQRWYREHGHAPTQGEWSKGVPDYPHYMTVTKKFGRWNAVIEAAGLPSRPQGVRQDWIDRRNGGS